MHQLGAHLKAVANVAGRGQVMLHDGAYDFEEQRQYAANQLQLKKGDSIDVECTYENGTGKMVSIGASSLQEMCILGLYRYPVAGEGLICAR